MRKRIIPLTRPDIRKEDISEVIRVLKTGMLVQGVEVQGLESTISQMIGTTYCSAVSNGTASLHLALIALGISRGDEVIVPALSYIATANVVELVGATTVFVDVHPRYFNIDENKIERAITAKTKAIIPVHEFGLSAVMPEILRITKKHNLRVIEDAACALGATYDGKYTGSFGDFGSFSLHPRKAVTSGEGGLIVTSHPDLDVSVKTLRNHGIAPNSFPMEFVLPGFNYRMTDFQAVLVHKQIERLNETLTYRRKLASIYLNEVKNNSILLPDIPEKAEHTWQTFHILTENNQVRNKLMAYLKDRGVMTNYGAQCIPAMTYYQKKYGHDCLKRFPNAYNAYSSGLAIPLYERLSESNIRFISKLLNKFH